MKNKKTEEKKEKYTGAGVAMGIVFGVIIGIATDNIGLWVSLGIVFGVAFESEYFKKKK